MNTKEECRYIIEPRQIRTMKLQKFRHYILEADAKDLCQLKMMIKKLLNISLVQKGEEKFAKTSQSS